MKRREFLTKTGVAGTGLALMHSAGAEHRAGQSQAYQPSALIGWNGAATSVIDAARFTPTTAARALAMVFEAVNNAWASYDDDAAFTLSGLRKREDAENRTNYKMIAVSFVAYAVVVDLFPTQQSRFDLALASDTAGLSRRYGGIHFERADVQGRVLGRQAGQMVLGRQAGQVVLARVANLYQGGGSDSQG